MSDPVIYYGPALAPTALVIRSRENGLVSLSRPDSEEIIVTGVRLVEVPAEGRAVLVTEATPAPAPKPGKKPKSD